LAGAERVVYRCNLTGAGKTLPALLGIFAPFAEPLRVGCHFGSSVAIGSDHQANMFRHHFAPFII
jgi:hypothetical protein